MTIRIFVAGKVVIHELAEKTPPKSFDYKPDPELVGDVGKLTVSLFVPDHRCYLMGTGADGIPEYEWT